MKFTKIELLIQVENPAQPGCYPGWSAAALLQIQFFPGWWSGEAATQSFLYVYSAMNQINQKRDIVLVDNEVPVSLTRWPARWMTHRNPSRY
jgi:hypothetical protein